MNHRGVFAMDPPPTEVCGSDPVTGAQRMPGGPGVQSTAGTTAAAAWGPVPVGAARSLGPLGGAAAETQACGAPAGVMSAASGDESAAGASVGSGVPASDAEERAPAVLPDLPEHSVLPAEAVGTNPPNTLGGNWALMSTGGSMAISERIIVKTIFPILKFASGRKDVLPFL